MIFKRTHDWVQILLWVGVILTLCVLGYALWYSYFDIAITATVVMIVFLLFLGYIKYLKIITLRRRFTMIQETFTTAMLIYFAYTCFSDTRMIPGEKEIQSARRKWDEVYEKSRSHITVPLITTAVKTIGDMKNIKDAIMAQVKNFASADGFNLDNAETLTKDVSAFTQKIRQMVDMIHRAFSKSSSVEKPIKNHKEQITQIKKRMKSVSPKKADTTTSSS